MTLNDPVAGSVSDVPELLLVEDNALHARLVTTMLADVWPQGVPLRHVKRLEGALESVEASRPGCVLLDLVLPDATNLEAVYALVAFAPGLPIVVLSSHHDEAMAQAAIRAGAQDFLVKGTATSENLGRAIRFAIERTRQPDGDDPPAAEVVVAGRVVLDRTGKMLYAEAGTADLLGRSPQDVIGTPLLEVVHPADRALWVGALERAAATPENEPVELVVRYLHPSGAEIRVRVELSVLGDAQGEAAAFLASLSPMPEEGTASSGAYAVVTEWSEG